MTSTYKEHHKSKLLSQIFRISPQGPSIPRWLLEGADRMQTQYAGLRTTTEFETVLKTFSNLEDRPFEVFVVGQGNFGKSTLLNALIGQKLSQVHFLPATRAFLRYIATPTPSGMARLFCRLQPDIHSWLEPHLGEGTRCGELFGASEHKIPVDLAEFLLAEDASKAGKQKTYRPAIVEFEREVTPGPGCPFPPTVRLVDTQGLNQLFPDELHTLANQEDAETTRSRFSQWINNNPRGQHIDWQLRRCDAVLWLAHARKPAAAVTSAALEHFAQYGKRTVLALTNIDKVQGGVDGLREVMEQVERAHGDLVAHICPVNGKQAMEASLSNDPKSRAESGLDTLAKVLHRVAVGDAQAARITGAYNSLRATERQQRHALLIFAMEVQYNIDRFISLRKKTEKMRKYTIMALEQALTQSANQCQQKLHRRVTLISFEDTAFSATEKIDAHSLGTAHQGAASLAMETALDRLRAFSDACFEDPFHLPYFDAEGKEAGFTIKAEGTYFADPPIPAGFSFTLQLSSQFFGRLWAGVKGFLGNFSKAAAESAERDRMEMLSERRTEITTQFDRAWRPFCVQVEEDYTAAISAGFDQLLIAIDKVKQDLETHEGQPLKQTKIDIQYRLKDIALPPILLTSLNRLLSRVQLAQGKRESSSQFH